LRITKPTEGKVRDAPSSSRTGEISPEWDERMDNATVTKKRMRTLSPVSVRSPEKREEEDDTDAKDKEADSDQEPDQTAKILEAVRQAPYGCPACRSRYSTQQDLEEHIMSANHEVVNMHLTEEELKALRCPLCPRTFTQKYKLQRHFLIHTGEKPFTCTHCKRKFTQRGNLNQHVRIHTGERPYKVGYA